ncbi:uncharacterized protein LOC117790098 [Drosophila innubila]|uniref:uncharacterized protein LOC117790098 n=1 Tax=Drosophila innubila TaxID=198719 RepID=UPI00148E3F7F|nr:uncharacterized protein LOC117790098 [Drosophila innubila]
MDHLGPLCLMIILMLHCVYAEYYSRTAPPIVLFNPFNGQEMDPRLFGAVHLRSSRETNSPSVNDNMVQLPSMGSPCSCEDYVCKCCMGLGLGVVNQTTCVKIQYDWRVFGVTVFIESNDHLLTSFGLSARNMPDFCAPLLLPIPLFTCLRFSNIEVVDMDNNIHLCTSLVFKIIFSEIYEYKFSCFQLGPKGVSIVQDMNPSEKQADQPLSQPE